MSSELIRRARGHGARTALVTSQGIFSYAELLDRSAAAASRLLAGRDDLEDERVCFLVPPGWDYVATLWGIWRAGGHATPLATSHPAAELAYAPPFAPVYDPVLIAATVASKALASRPGRTKLPSADG